MSISLSVLLPVYNGDTSKRFEECLQSISSSLCDGDECLILVDGPIGDSLSAVIDRFEFDKRFLIKKFKDQRGLISVLNDGIKLCNNDIIMRSDADDINTANRFSVTRDKFLSIPSLHLLGGGIIETYGNGLKRQKLMPVEISDIKKYSRFRNPFNHMTVAFRKETAIKLGGYPNILFKEDYALWLLFLQKGYMCVNDNSIFSLVDASNGMISRRKNMSAIISEYKFAKFRLLNKIDTYYIVLFSMFLRVLMLCLPLFILRNFYLEKLRQKVND
jgi:glycosyltransferase involved in cell wall biosynthesis